MKRFSRMLAVLFAAALTLVSATTASPTTGKQSIAMEASKMVGPEGTATFVLTPVSSGTLQHDTGTFTFTSSSQKKLVRDGQSVIVFNATLTWIGKLGTFVTHMQVNDVAVGKDYRVGTGLWSLVGAKGTGQYASVSGSGRSAYVLTPNGRVHFQWEGLATKS